VCGLESRALVRWDSDALFDRTIQLAILAVGAYVAYVPPSSSPSPAAPIDPPRSISAVGEIVTRYGPWAALVIVTAVNYAITRRRPPRPKGPFLRGQLVKGNGTAHQLSQNLLDTAALSDFKKDYKVAVICGYNDPTADKFEDVRISRSAAYTISGQELEIVIRHEPAMTDLLNATLRQAAEQATPKPGFRGYQKDPRKKKHVLINYELNVWTEVVLLPNGVEPTLIQRLSDVRRLNGKIVTEEVQEKRITPIV
jgi:hypothetical protein